MTSFTKTKIKFSKWGISLQVIRTTFSNLWLKVECALYCTYYIVACVEIVWKQASAIGKINNVRLCE